MRPLIDLDFRNVAVIKTRPGIMPNKFMINGLCWMCATAHGCEGNCSPHGYHYDYYTCPSCRRMVPWSSGGTDSLDCADCWVLTEERKTMEEKTEVPGQTMEDKNKVPSIPRSSGHICGTCGHDQTVENQAVGVGFSDLCTIRGSKIKSNTKALEKIIARQEKRIEELAMQVGKMESMNRDTFDMLDSVLKAAGANGISQVLSILVAVKAGKPIPEVSEMPEFPSRSTTFYMTKP